MALLADMSTVETPANEFGSRPFWALMAHAVVVGVFGAIAALAFLGVTGIGETFYGDTGTGWFDGHWWWILVAVGAGVVVGILRKILALPKKTPGLIEDLKLEHVDPALVPSIVAVSAVSLIGGASVGPEVALGQMGGGAAAWTARRRSLDDDDTKALTLAGIGGAFGGLFSSPFLSITLVLEIARPPAKRFLKSFYATLVASALSFGVYFAIAGSVFFDIYEVPAYAYEDWHLLAGVVLGILAAGVALVTGIIGTVLTRIFARIAVADVVKPIIGGLIFGLIGVALPLTNFTGSGQLSVILESAGELSLALLVAILIGKMIAFGASLASGFIGGPIFPILFLGGTAGLIVNQVVPEVPLGLAFACMLAAVPGAVVAAPFSMVLLAALVTQMGTLQTAPVIVAVGTAYLAATVAQHLMARRNTPPNSTTDEAPPPGVA